MPYDLRMSAHVLSTSQDVQRNGPPTSWCYPDFCCLFLGMPNLAFLRLNNNLLAQGLRCLETASLFSEPT